MSLSPEVIKFKEGQLYAIFGTNYTAAELIAEYFEELKNKNSLEDKILELKQGLKEFNEETKASKEKLNIMGNIITKENLIAKENIIAEKDLN